MNKRTLEVNFDGLVGPTHNYSGLSYGNLASLQNKACLSNPRAAALQGLEKMKFLYDLGFTQGVLPPQERPSLQTLRQLGYIGNDHEVLREASVTDPILYNNCCSAASMWTANAATVAPSIDSIDHKVHFTPANLSSNFHRSIESFTTGKILRKIFNDPTYFIHHSPLPSGLFFADEGAANHSRLCANYGSPGLQFFVWGRNSFKDQCCLASKFPARQALEASESIARLHRLKRNHLIFAKQNPKAIDAGVFHNDVIAVANENVFFYHEEAYEDHDKTLSELSDKFLSISGSKLNVIRVKSSRLSLKDSVETYLFNSQIVSFCDGSMAIIAPSECEKHQGVYEILNEVVNDDHNPINKLYFLNLHESMRNGGGPACLRLRIVLTSEELAAMHQKVLLNNTLYAELKSWIIKHYRETLSPKDLCNPLLYEEAKTALNELTKILDLGSIYNFQA